MTTTPRSDHRRTRTPWARPSDVSDDSDERFSAEQDGSPEGTLGDKRATVSWEVEGARVTAELRASGQRLEVRRFVVEVDTGSVPAAARRLPGDTAILRALSSYGPRGRDTIRYLFIATPRMKAWAAAHVARGATLDNKFLNDVTGDYVQEQVDGPRSRAVISAQVTAVQEVLREGGEAARTKNVIAMLTTHYPDMSETTAYRRLSEAKLRLKAGASPRSD